MKKKEKLLYALAGFAVFGIIAATVLIPKIISWYYDATAVGAVHLENTGDEDAREDLNADEKLYIVSNALNNRILPQSDHFAAIRWQDIFNNKTQSYAFQPIYRESEYNPEACAKALNALKTELDLLNEKGVLPDLGFNPDHNDYEASLFSAIDIRKPQKNVTVWQINFNGTIIRNGLVDCIMDAQTHRLYSVSIRAEKLWAQYDADNIIRLWAEYLGAGAPQPYQPDNPLVEDATYYQKYTLDGKTVVTVGYYEGIGEFFIKITK